jgi:hypothetical protein
MSGFSNWLLVLRMLAVRNPPTAAFTLIISLCAIARTRPRLLDDAAIVPMRSFAMGGESAFALLLTAQDSRIPKHHRVKGMIKTKKRGQKSLNETERKARRVRLPGFITDEDIGLGEVIKRATSAVGIKPCGGCGRRAAALNRWVVFTGPRSR